MAFVNFVKESIAFMEYASDNGLTGNERLLWYALFHIMNQRADGSDWPDDMVKVSNKRLLSFLPYSEDALVSARNRLAQRGIIKYKPGKRNAESPEYALVYFHPELSTVSTQNSNVYPFSAGNIRGNIGGNVQGNMRGNIGGNVQGNPRGNIGGNMGDIIYKPKQGNQNEYENVNANVPEDVDENVDDAADRARERKHAHMREVVMLRYKDAFGRPATVAEIDTISRMACGYDMQDELVADVLNKAAEAGARNVVAYVQTLFKELDAADITTSREYHEDRFLTDAARGKFDFYAPDDAMKERREVRERRAAERQARQEG